MPNNGLERPSDIVSSPGPVDEFCTGHICRSPCLQTVKKNESIMTHRCLSMSPKFPGPNDVEWSCDTIPKMAVSMHEPGRCMTLPMHVCCKDSYGEFDATF